MNNILLLNLNWNKCHEFGAMTHNAVGLPLEYVYILSDLKNKNYNVSFIDLWALHKNLEDVHTEIQKSEFIVVCSSPSYLFWRDGVWGIEFLQQNLDCIKKINPSAILILIGPHGTVLPETLFSKNLDFIIRGEPELIIADLIRTIQNNLSYPSGVCYRKNGSWFISDETIEIPDLNMLPSIRFDLVNIDLYPYPLPPEGVGEGITALYEASRGCIFRCIFCWRKGFRDKYRRKSLNRIKEELLALKNVKYIYLIDEIFPIDTEWCFQVCSLLKECGIRWGCQVRPEFIVNDAIIDMIISKGCKLIQIGLETTDPLSYALAKKTKIADLEHLNINIQKLISNNITIDLFLIFGLPKDSGKSQLNMVKQLRSFSLDKINIIAHSAIPFPGTELWDMGIKEGRALKTWADIKPFIGLISNQFKDKNHLQKNTRKAIAYLNLFKTIKIIKNRLNKSHRIFLRDIFKLSFYMVCFIFPNINNIKGLIYKDKKNEK